jgi:hypothetical protein
MWEQYKMNWKSLVSGVALGAVVAFAGASANASLYPIVSV